MKAYADLYELPERARIDVIGRTAADGHIVGFVVEDEAKADRYVEQLLERFKVRIVDRVPGPVPNTILVRVGPLAH